MRGRPAVAVMLLLAAAIAVSARAQTPVFRSYEAFPVGAQAQAVAVADVTGDRRSDVVLSDPDHLFVSRQQADGTLAAPEIVAKLQSGNSQWRAGLAVADLNGDGKQELAVATRAGVQVFRQAGGSLVPSTLIRLTFDATTVAAADLDGDGRPELVVSGRIDLEQRPELYVLWNRGSSWLPRKIGGFMATAIRVADINGDRAPDIVPLSFGTTSKPTLWLYLNRGARRFTREIVQVADAANRAPTALALGDVNGDRRTDVEFVNEQNKPFCKLAVLLQTSSGKLSQPTLYDTLDAADAVTVADLNGDGRGDVVVLHGGYKSFGVYYQRRDGALAPEELVALPNGGHHGPNGLAIADVSSDRLPDLAIADDGFTQGLVVVREASR